MEGREVAEQLAKLKEGDTQVLWVTLPPLWEAVTDKTWTFVHRYKQGFQENVFILIGDIWTIVSRNNTSSWVRHNIYFLRKKAFRKLYTRLTGMKHAFSFFLCNVVRTQQSAHLTYMTAVSTARTGHGGMCWQPWPLKSGRRLITSGITVSSRLA